MDEQCWHEGLKGRQAATDMWPSLLALVVVISFSKAGQETCDWTGNAYGNIIQD